MRKSVVRKSYVNLIVSSIIIGVLATFLAVSLKRLTEFFEEHIFNAVITSGWSLLFIILPSIGITLVYFARKHLFKGKKNKGIKEIFHTLDHRRDELPFYKVPSHYLNGFLTIIFGGSTGVEVSTVVATAAMGASLHRKDKVPNAFKTELICAGVAAGIAILFASPIAGFLFAVEVIARKITKTIVLSCAIAVFTAWLFLHFNEVGQLFDFSVITWNKEALPFMVLLSVLAGLTAVYFTKSVIIIKDKIGGIKNNFLRVNTGALLVGIGIFFFPQLYGDSYHAITELMHESVQGIFSAKFALVLLALVFLKPLAASLTLGAGGDGGVFAPSIVAGAILGMFIAIVCNHFFNTELIVLNFALIGAAAMLSAAIHAPLTALFLVCGIVSDGFILFFPILIGSFIAKYVAKLICSYTVYSYKSNFSGHVSGFRR
ncbi:chloride channel protein, CIC family [Salegentibacter echinorum]|uniref:Chloride channel protein, CIC family n=1 Tax=Salegentibacter echinorum TaxID=1073325 RepID=A0A1M5C7A8_SALEC|nr:chloride channel protein [Salegentibacter echinorum]SHF50302.1 chloride channel protein, CIC family [Salegentibacter echinorum]